MKKWLKRIRGAVGMGLVWAVRTPRSPQLVPQDVRNFRELERVFAAQEYDYVYHLAARCHAEHHDLVASSAPVDIHGA